MDKKQKILYNKIERELNKVDTSLSNIRSYFDKLSDEEGVEENGE